RWRHTIFSRDWSSDLFSSDFFCPGGSGEDPGIFRADRRGCRQGAVLPVCGTRRYLKGVRAGPVASRGPDGGSPGSRPDSHSQRSPCGALLSGDGSRAGGGGSVNGHSGTHAAADVFGPASVDSPVRGFFRTSPAFRSAVGKVLDPLSGIPEDRTRPPESRGVIFELFLLTNWVKSLYS